MRSIIKGTEPASLAQHRCSQPADYDNYPDKATLRTSLVSEQRGLCCYCLSQIQPQNNAIKIEHWRSQSQFPAEQLDYANLLGACLGSEGQPRRLQHCDTHKGDDTLSKNPANQSHRIEKLIRFTADGTIEADDPTLDREINDVLNLNLPFLKRNRKAVLEGFKAALDKRGMLQSIGGIASYDRPTVPASLHKLGRRGKCHAQGNPRSGKVLLRAGPDGPGSAARHSQPRSGPPLGRPSGRACPHRYRRAGQGAAAGPPARAAPAHRES